MIHQGDQGDGHVEDGARQFGDPIEMVITGMIEQLMTLQFPQAQGLIGGDRVGAGRRIA